MGAIADQLDGKPREARTAPEDTAEARRESRAMVLVKCQSMAQEA